MNCHYLGFVFAKNKNSFEVMGDFRHKYGPIYTIWIGLNPMVIVNDLEYAKDAFTVRKSEIAGRMQLDLRMKEK